MKKYAIILYLFIAECINVFSQTQYDYYDDDVAHQKNTINGHTIMGLLLIGFVVFIIWFINQIIKEKKESKIKASKSLEDQKLESYIESIKKQKEKTEQKRQEEIQKEIQKEKTPIDLGLSVLWSDSNLFVECDNGKGAKFSWGDIQKKTFFSHKDCKLIRKSSYELKRILGNDNLLISGNVKYDAASKLWGDNWRLPQKNEIDELINNCEWEWSNKNGIFGYIVKGKNGNTIFLPVTGEKKGYDIESPQIGFYWTGSANGDVLGENAHYLYFDENQRKHKSDGIRWHGMAIRPVWSKNKETFEKNGFTLSMYGAKLIKCNDVENCQIPEGVKIISKVAFKEANNIKNLYIPNSVEEIEEQAFSSLSIETVNIPRSIKKWGESVFSFCTKLKKVNIEKGLSVLGKSMFSWCDNLEIINIPDSVKEIPNGMFEGCNSLKNIVLPSGITKVGEDAFLDCRSLKSINLPTSLIGIMDDTFNFCFNLTNVVINEGLVAICRNSFYACKNLTRIRIPTTIQHIDKLAFNNCWITLEVPKCCVTYFNELNLEGVKNIVEYDAESPNNLEDLKEKCRKFLTIQKFLREQHEREERREMGIMTKEEYDFENMMYFDMLDEINEKKELRDDLY